ncbi:methyltransferase [Prolixibacteraceae bacterium Z1-6]|uniref:tRNA1(Val) (adenine(37)-N6)-methyltransferase n=1 Tax=Draconibacterium aestuarii TaxID=2998507 RepID=A0A9X3F8W9_9BACT|nr:methyltransferase [Prolixibacteraceae bacterium Z1-6]
MGKNNYFQFKQFTVRQEKAAMKVGTDGVLLGAWADVEKCDKILDVGTGTGLIALMLAQRSTAQITAIEIEENAAAEAKSNVADSDWSNRIDVQNASFQEFAKNSVLKYDLIVSNPPFFSNNLKASNAPRNLARHNDSLSFLELITNALNLFDTNGRLAVILPVEPAEEFNKLACKNGLYLLRRTEVSPSVAKAVNRVLMEFTKKKTACKAACLPVYSKDGSDYSVEFKTLTKDFYLRF